MIYTNRLLLINMVLLLSLWSGRNVSQSVQPLPIPAQYWQWVEDSSLSGKQVEDCEFLSIDNGWAVGGNSEILHWDGNEWATAPAPNLRPYDTLHAIDMVATDNGWVVGSRGYILHWNGNDWIDVSFKDTDNDLFDVSFATSNLGFATGGLIEDERRERLVLQWTGNYWNPITFPQPQDIEPRVTTVEMVSEFDGWAGGLAALYRWNGKSWSPFESTNLPPFFEIHDFSMLNANDIWATGYRDFEREDGTRVDGGSILHWNGADWIEVYKGPYNFSSIKMLSTNEGWAVGRYRTDMRPKTETENMIMYWDGEHWSEFQGVNQLSLKRICGFDNKHLWIFGTGGVMRLVEKLRATSTLDATKNPKDTAPGTLAPSKLSELSITPTLQATKSETNDNPSVCPSIGFSIGLIIFPILLWYRPKRQIK